MSPTGRADRAGTPVDPWLEARLAGVPVDLAAAVREGFARAGGGSSRADGTAGAAEHGPGVSEVAERLCGAALAELDAVARARQDRRAALRLLAADALLTYAFEAASDPSIGGGTAAAARLAARIGPAGRLGARLSGSGESAG